MNTERVNEKLVVMVTPSERERVELVAGLEDRSMSSLCRLLIREALDAREVKKK